KILEFFTSCPDRRVQQYEKHSWWQFLEAELCSPKFQRQLKAIPRMLVAMDGPTTQMWIEPWTAYLSSLGVGLHPGTGIAGIEVGGGQIAGVALAGGGVATADYYVLAVPIDAVVGMITPAMAALDPALATLASKNPAELVSWMSGIQFYLYEDV